MTGRFAPSPSGRMHLGNAFSALMSWLYVRKNGGTMVMRIEDLDKIRCKKEYCDLVKDDLAWLGLDWDLEAPMQSTRGEAYEAALARLGSLGVLFDCACSRADLGASSAPHASDGHVIYSGRCRDLPDEQKRIIASKPHSVRVKVPQRIITFSDRIYGEYSQDLAKECGDFVLKKADGMYAYQLAVVVDDIFCGVDTVVRGCDLISSTPRQIYLYELLNEAPPEYCHIPMLVDSSGRKLSKRDRDCDFGYLRQSLSPQQVIGRLAFMSGLIDRDEPVSAGELLQIFDIERIKKQNIAL